MVKDLNLLRTVIAVAELGSFTAAAEKLGIARPQVSLQVRRLERELGMSLFNRTTRQVSLTDSGQRLVEQCAPLLQTMQEALERVGSSRAQLRGRLRIAAPVEHTVEVLSLVVVEFMNRYPDVQVELVVSDKVQDLIAEGIDLAIRVGWLRDSSSRVAKLGEFEQAVLASPAYLGRHRRPERPEDLDDHAWIALTLLRAPLTWNFKKGSETVTVRLTPRLRTDSAMAMRALLVSGAGASVAIMLHLATEVRSGSLVRLLPDWSLPRGAIYAVYPPAPRTAPTARAFVDLLKAAIARNA